MGAYLEKGRPYFLFMKVYSLAPVYDKFGNQILRTPNLDCPACCLYRVHTKEEMKKFHPLAGTGKSTERRLAGG